MKFEKESNVAAHLIRFGEVAGQGRERSPGSSSTTFSASLPGCGRAVFSHAPQQRLYFRPLPQGHETLRATVATRLLCFDLPLNKPSMISISQISTAIAGCEKPKP